MSKWPPLLEGFGSALSHPSCRYKIVWNSACYRETGGNSTENKQEIQASFLPTWRDLKVGSFESTKQRLSRCQRSNRRMQQHFTVQRFGKIHSFLLRAR